MNKRSLSALSTVIQPTHEFDGRIYVEENGSSLCNVKIWLPMDCHEDAQIAVMGSSAADIPWETIMNDHSGQTRLISEITISGGLEIEATSIIISNLSFTGRMKTGGANITINHIGQLRISQKLNHKGETTDATEEPLTSVSFLLSDLKYGAPATTLHMDLHGNRENKTSRPRELRMQLETQTVTLNLYKHWAWRKAEFGRDIVGSCPAFLMQGGENLHRRDLKNIQKLAEDACVLLTLAARHLTVVHVMVIQTPTCSEQKWFYPLHRQRATTEEGGTGPLITVAQLENFFEKASRTWAKLAQNEQDAIRSAVFAIHPFSDSSTESYYMHMFAALEGLAIARFPKHYKIRQKIKAMISAFAPYSSGLWPILGANKTGLAAVRDHIAHGRHMNAHQREALLPATDHLQIWLERFLLKMLEFELTEVPHDWLSMHAQSQRDELPNFQKVWKT